MESLFDLIKGNIWMLAIIIGIVSSMFSKSKKNQGGQQRKGTPTTPVNQKQVHEQKRTEHELPKTIRQLYEEAKKAMVIPQTTIEEINHDTKQEEEAKARMDELKRQQQESERQRQLQIEKAAALRKGIADASSPIYQPSFKITPEKVIDGIIMSEVLGPPRAKSRHRSGRPNIRV